MYRNNLFAAEKKINEQTKTIEDLSSQIEAYRCEKHRFIFEKLREAIFFLIAIAVIPSIFAIASLNPKPTNRIIYMSHGPAVIESIDNVDKITPPCGEIKSYLGLSECSND
jgi:hypothetical protein